MKIKFLGTSAGWPLPRLGCDCSICSSKDPKDKRTRSQILINDILLLDVGPDTYQHLSTGGINPNKIKYAAITHEHPDHTFGLWDLGHIYNKNYKISVVIGESTFRKTQKLFFYKEYHVLKVLDDQEVKTDGLIVKLFSVNHTDSSFGIYVEESKTGKSLFYVSDFKSIPDQTRKKIKDLDLAILDGSELKINTPSHRSIVDSIKLDKELGAKNVYFTHLGHRTLPHRELEKYIQKEGGGGFHIPYDGLEINI